MALLTWTAVTGLMLPDPSLATEQAVPVCPVNQYGDWPTKLNWFFRPLNRKLNGKTPLIWKSTADIF